jgi:hypothetical protein
MRIIAILLLGLLCFSLASCPKPADKPADTPPASEDGGEGTWDSGGE